MRSILALPNDYVVLDLETTGQNPQEDDIIEISAVRYRNGIEVANFDQLISVGYSIPAFISSLTGITDEMLAGKPRIEDVLPAFSDFIGSDILIGHNIACFDSCFLARAYEEILHIGLNNQCVDTLRIAKRLDPKLPRHNLQFLALHFGVSVSTAHRGKADCKTSHAIYQAMRNEILSTCGEEAFTNYSARKPKTKVSEIIPESEVTNSEHPFYQKIFVFTGALSLTREEAMQLAVNVGAVVKTSVTKKTNYLVVGGQDLTRVGEDGMSSKEEKAHALNSEGKANIHIISEKEFLDTINK